MNFNFNRLYNAGANRLKCGLCAFRRGFVPFKASETILLTGSPRSGTTWLGNILSTAPNYFMITEPFSLDARLEKLGFSWRTFKDPKENWDVGTIFISNLVQGKNLIPASFQDATWKQCLREKFLLLKCVRVNRLLPWLIHHIEIKKYVYLIRHPCSVVASQMKHNAFQRIPRLNDYNTEILNLFFPHLEKELCSLRHEEELRAMEWCLDQYIPLKFLGKNETLTLYYEDLVRKGPDSIKEIFDRLNLQRPSNCDALWSKNSRERHSWSADHEKESIENRVGHWKHFLSNDQIKNILAVVNLFKITGFSDEIFPEFAKISVRV